jgi:hypothetical protein
MEGCLFSRATRRRANRFLLPATCNRLIPNQNLHVIQLVGNENSIQMRVMKLTHTRKSTMSREFQHFEFLRRRQSRHSRSPAVAHWVSSSANYGSSELSGSPARSASRRTRRNAPDCHAKCCPSFEALRDDASLSRSGREVVDFADIEPNSPARASRPAQLIAAQRAMSAVSWRTPGRIGLPHSRLHRGTDPNGPRWRE